MTKTVILTGAELRVEKLGGQNAVIKNLGSETIWASAFPNVTAGADNVIEIPTGSGEVLLDARGTVYLLGNGKVQCTGTDQATVNFKMPSSSVSGGGGEEPIGETMPHLDGLQGYYDWQDADIENAVWNSKIDGESTLELVGDFSKMDDCFRFGSSGLGKCYMDNPAHTIYAVMRVSDPYFTNNAYPQFISEIANFQYSNRLCMCLVPANRNMAQGADTGMRISTGSWGQTNWCPNTYGVDWIVICLSRDENFNFRPYMNSRFDYAEWGTIPVGANGYKGITLLNSESNDNVHFNPENQSIATDWKFFAIGDGIQTSEQIRENIAWLARKYGIGGG